jgi:hypothetical protein
MVSYQEEAYNFIKYWLPIISAFLMVHKGWNTFKTNVNGWADKLLNNHLSHIQSSTQETVILLRDLKDREDRKAEKVEAVRIANEDIRRTLRDSTVHVSVQDQPVRVTTEEKHGDL